jgi:hypothetical protein
VDSQLRCLGHMARYRAFIARAEPNHAMSPSAPKAWTWSFLVIPLHVDRVIFTAGTELLSLSSDPLSIRRSRQRGEVGAVSGGSVAMWVTKPGGSDFDAHNYLVGK